MGEIFLTPLQISLQSLVHMKKTFAISLSTVKLAYLVCFSVMGLMGTFGVVQAEVMDMPCHQIDVSMEAEDNMKESCSACEDSEKLWSQDLVFTNKELVLKDFAPAIIPFVWSDIELRPIEIVTRESVPDPPDIVFWASPLRTQEGIVLLN